MSGQKLAATKVDRHNPTTMDEVLSDGNGLYIRFRKQRDGGYSKVWMYTYKVGRNSLYITLGAHKSRLTEFEIALFGLPNDASLTLENARKMIAELNALRKKKVDPKAWMESEILSLELSKREKNAKEKLAREKEESAHTVVMLFESWRKVDLISRKDEGSETIRAFHKDVFPSIGAKLAESITQADVMGILDQIVIRGSNRMAKRLLSDMRQMFNFAVDREIIVKDPTARIKKARIGGKEVIRTRYLNSSELTEFAKKIVSANMTVMTEAALWLMLTTLCRVGEISRARWQDIDLIGGTWLIPKEHSKNNVPLMVYLSDLAKLQFLRLRHLKSNEIWVFPNRSGTSHVCVKSITKQVADRQRLKPMSNRSSANESLVLSRGSWTPHDLRRTGSTTMGEMKIDSDIIERCLNHTEPDKMKKTYQQQELIDEQTKAWHLLGKRLTHFWKIYEKTVTENGDHSMLNPISDLEDSTQINNNSICNLPLL